MMQARAAGGEPGGLADHQCPPSRGAATLPVGGTRAISQVVALSGCCSAGAALPEAVVSPRSGWVRWHQPRGGGVAAEVRGVEHGQQQVAGSRQSERLSPAPSMPYSGRATSPLARRSRSRRRKVESTVRDVAARRVRMSCSIGSKLTPKVAPPRRRSMSSQLAFRPRSSCGRRPEPSSLPDCYRDGNPPGCLRRVQRVDPYAGPLRAAPARQHASAPAPQTQARSARQERRRLSGGARHVHHIPVTAGRADHGV